MKKREFNRKEKDYEKYRSKKPWPLTDQKKRTHYLIQNNSGSVSDNY